MNKIQLAFIIKLLEQISYRCKVPQHKKGYMSNQTTDIILTRETLAEFLFL